MQTVPTVHVIVFTAVRVEAKPNELACPKTVNSSIIFDPDNCCQPKQTHDSIIPYPISTLRSVCSGQTQCQSSLAEREVNFSINGDRTDSKLVTFNRTDLLSSNFEQ
ncbi:hypothetical protein CHS0354_012976 [Potamilus streckersoni]|uniref:Uncharacterized protein n=1 Tax=Potamilus streckersoni TaxID=2493646 RepID=A0AAE0T7N2_9BIVA|nr:hypothetical protein CHS0354_012976 [Potamilus streckersoni]